MSSALFCDFVGSGTRSKVCLNIAFFTTAVVLLRNLNNPNKVMIFTIQMSGRSLMVSLFRPPSGMKTKSSRSQKASNLVSTGKRSTQNPYNLFQNECYGRGTNIA